MQIADFAEIGRGQLIQFTITVELEVGLLRRREESVGRGKPIEFLLGRIEQHVPEVAQNEVWIACRKFLAAVRAAGATWIAYRRAQRTRVLRLRSLMVRGRARPRMRTRGADPIIFPIFRLPNELCWHVLQFWRATCDATGEVI